MDSIESRAMLLRPLSRQEKRPACQRLAIGREATGGQLSFSLAFGRIPPLTEHTKEGALFLGPRCGPSQEARGIAAIHFQVEFTAGFPFELSTGC